MNRPNKYEKGASVGSAEELHERAMAGGWFFFGHIPRPLHGLVVMNMPFKGVFDAVRKGRIKHATVTRGYAEWAVKEAVSVQ